MSSCGSAGRITSTSAVSKVARCRHNGKLPATGPLEAVLWQQRQQIDQISISLSSFLSLSTFSSSSSSRLAGVSVPICVSDQYLQPPCHGGEMDEDERTRGVTAGRSAFKSILSGSSGWVFFGVRGVLGFFLFFFCSHQSHFWSHVSLCLPC